MASEVVVTWEELLAGLQEAFSRDRVDVDQVKLLMSSYQSRRSDWQQYEHFDKHKYVWPLCTFIDAVQTLSLSLCVCGGCVRESTEPL